MSQAGWVRASKARPCRVCEKPDNCEALRVDDGWLVYCGRVSEGAIRQNDGGQWLHKVADDSVIRIREPRREPEPPQRAKKSAAYWADLVRFCEECGKGRLTNLADTLGVSVKSLRRLHVGYSVQQEAGMFAERNAAGEFVGINRRFGNGEKKRSAGGESGLTFADDWDAGDGPLLLVEGGSDVAACLTMGLNAVGRPSNTGGVKLLGELLANVPRTRTVIVIGERDRKRHGDLKENARKRHSPECEGCSACWPGWFGAVNVAKQLAEKLARPIAWALPPDDAKDSRAWWLAHQHEGTPDELGRRFVAALELTNVEPPRIEIITPDDRLAITLNEARERMHSAKTNSIGTPGIYLDRSPTGSGKSFSDIAAVQQNLAAGGRSLIALPTHANCHELLAEFSNAGITATAFPQRATSNGDGMAVNCWNPLADDVEAAGLPVMRTVCQMCEHRARCNQVGYIAAVIAAEGADVNLATHARASWSGLRKLCGGRTFVSIHENALNVLRPTASCGEADIKAARGVLDRLLNDPKSLNWFGDATRKDEDGNVGHNEQREKRREKLYEFTKLVADVTDELGEALVSAKRTSEFQPKRTMPVPAGAELLLFSAARRERITFIGKAWKVILGIATGETHSSAVIVERFDVDADGEPIARRNVLAVWHNSPPGSSATVWLNDATASPERLASVLGVNVSDMTPDGRIELVQRAVQVPRDITRKTSAKTVAALLRGVLIDHPNFRRVGVICHRTHVQAVETIGAEFRQRIAKVSYFGSGDERASNEWHHECDAVIVLGTPRIPTEAVAAFLIQCGDILAATRQPGWEKYRWRGITESGQPREVDARGYRDEAWRAAHRDTVRATLVQAIGRGRGILSDGIPVIVLTTEECGLKLADVGHEPRPLSDADQLLLDTLNTLAGEANPLSPPFASPESLQSLSYGKTGDPKPGDALRFVATADLASRLGKSVSGIRESLVRLEARSLVERDGERGGWRIVRQTGRAA